MLRLQDFGLIALMVISILIPACGGGGGVSESPLPTQPPQQTSSATILYWTPPAKDVAGAQIDPRKDIDYYEIFINTSGVFDSFDQPVAVVTPVDSSNSLITEFDLSSLAPFVKFDPKMFVSMRTVGMTGAKSGFSPAVPFDS
jgi:hypothetical protein